MVSKTTTSEKNLNNEHSRDNNKNTVQQAVNDQTVQYLSKC